MKCGVGDFLLHCSSIGLGKVDILFNFVVKVIEYCYNGQIS